MLDKLIEEVEKLADEAHAKLGVMLRDNLGDHVGNNWQGGRVNGIRTVLQLLYDMEDK